MLKTLAAKHKSAVSKVAAKHKAVVETLHGKRTCFEARVDRDGKQPLVARFGGLPVTRRKDAVLFDRVPDRPVAYPFKELTVRLRKGRCELCQEPAGRVQVHQIRKLAQLSKPGADQPACAKVMVRKRRKTLVVCHSCHDAIHDRHPPLPRRRSLESLVPRKGPRGSAGATRRRTYKSRYLAAWSTQLTLERLTRSADSDR